MKTVKNFSLGLLTKNKEQSATFIALAFKLLLAKFLLEYKKYTFGESTKNEFTIYHKMGSLWVLLISRKNGIMYLVTTNFSKIVTYSHVSVNIMNQRTFIISFQTSGTFGQSTFVF